MNIQEAKDSIRDAVSAYLAKDPAGNYGIPRSRQRPIMVMGAPGLGKTAIMSQVAAEMGIGFVAYTITHHTRQSAIGLPMIDRQEYDGRECAVTRYTMSEIIASVHDAMEAQGNREGILFIDEINCVSETLAPAMLDLLQNKKFGPHRIPDGWVLVAAGNPPEFNSSAREFDIATLDRIRVIEVEPDTDVWLGYALSAGIHESITYYLGVKPQSLLHIERTVDGPRFVTPRAWEDLSTVLREYDRMGFRADVGLISQYIRDPDIAAEFSRYLEFHRRYSDDHDVSRILATGEGDAQSLALADPVERLAVISVMIGSLGAEADVGTDLVAMRDWLAEARDSPGGIVAAASSAWRELDSNITPDRRRHLTFILANVPGIGADDDGIDIALGSLDDRISAARASLDAHIVNAMTFLRTSLGDGHEAASLLTGLIGSHSVVMFSAEDGALYRYNEELLSDGRNRRILDMLEAVRWRARSSACRSGTA